MFRRGISDVTRARLLAAALSAFFCLAVVGWGLVESAGYQREADISARQFVDSTRDRVAIACVGLSLSDKAKCIDDALDERRAYERAEYDLVAQRRSALWAYIMGAAAIVGVGLSAIGVGLVYTTFKETRRAADAAQDSNRPWVEIKILRKNYFEIQPQFARIELIAQIKNRGRSPANNLLIRSVILAVPAGGVQDGRKIINETLSAYIDQLDAVQPDNGALVFPEGEDEARRIGANISRDQLETEDIKTNGAWFWFGVGVRYKFNGRSFRTTYCYIIEFEGVGQTLRVDDYQKFDDHAFRLEAMASEYAT